MAGELAGMGTGRTGGREATTGVIPGRIALSVGCPDLSPPKGWKWTPLSSVAQLESGHTPSRKHPEYWDGGIPWIGIKDATENHGRTLSDTHQHVSILGLENSSARLLPANTVCLSRTASVGFVVVMGCPMATSQDFVNWVCGPNLEPHYLKYVLLAENEALWRFASGTTHQTIYYPEAKAFHVCLPPLPEQKAIAAILGALDDKIELNRRMNATLESMARALFQSWFVDFDPVRAKADGRTPSGMDAETAALFPAQFDHDETMLRPHGWLPKAVYDCATFINGVAFKNVQFSADGIGLPVVKIAELKDGITKQTKFTLDALAPKYKIHDGEILFSWSGSPDTSIDTFLWSGGDGWLNQHIFKVEFHHPAEKLFVYYLLKHLKSTFIEIARNKQTTGLGHVTAQDLKRLQVAFPPNPVLLAFQRLAQPIFDKTFATQTESRTLAALRDSLLPKLLRGEVRVVP